MVSTAELTEAQLLAVSAATLPLGTTLEVDVFLKPSTGHPALLFCAAGQIVDRQKLLAIQSDSLARLFIHSDDRGAYQRSLRKHLDTLLSDDSRPVVERFHILNDVIRDILSSEFATGTTDSIVATCQQLGTLSAQLLSEDPIAMRTLCNVLHHDYGTFTHSANVSVYALMLARHLGFAADELPQIAIGGLLHDLGKLDIDERILNKPGRLDDSERKIIETHPSLGIQRVAERQDLSVGQFMMIYQHHERIQGNGYPVGLTGDEIHPWARLCAIVDVFEALTSNRPYRQRLSTDTALAVLEKNQCADFDAEMVSCWRQITLQR